MSTPDQNTLGQMVEEIFDTVDGEVEDKLIRRWINRVIEDIETKREWNFLIKKTTGTVPAAASDGTATLDLPSDFRKFVRNAIQTNNEDITGTEDEKQFTTFFNTQQYDLIWNPTNLIWQAVFKGRSNTSPFSVNMTYYAEPLRLLEDSSQTRIPKYFVNLIIDGVLMKCYKKLGDLQEYILTERSYKTNLQDMIDHDARNMDDQLQMEPNRGQTTDDYGNYYEDQRFGGQDYSYGSFE